MGLLYLSVRGLLYTYGDRVKFTTTIAAFNENTVKYAGVHGMILKTIASF